MKNEIDFEDVQGLVRFGYGKLEKARYELLWVTDPAAARAWLRAVEVTNAAVTAGPPPTALQVAFTAPGLRALGLDDAVIAQFSHEFRSGMAEPSRSRQLGDVKTNAPEKWDWGGFGCEPHLVVMYFCLKDLSLDDFIASSKGAGWDEAFQQLPGGELRTSDLDAYEPFGFKDGISQPVVDWAQTLATTHAEYAYTNEVAAGEFLLGYPNVYGKITDRPLLDPSAATAHLHDAEGKKDLGRNGSYLVIRQLEQDVRTFWQTMRDRSGGDAAAMEMLAAAMVGRTREGHPLVPIEGKSIPGIEEKDAALNRFTFDQDASGARCPFGSHIRRANPRNADFPVRPMGLLKKLVTMLGFGPRGFRDDLMSSVRFHRILRRGREYGKELKPEDALQPDPADTEKRGIYFICVNANISRQFEFLQNAWMASTKFDGLSGESDPLVGNRQPIPGCPVTSHFTAQSEDGLRRRVEGLPQFVTVRGGAYFFLPGRRALRYIAAEK